MENPIDNEYAKQKYDNMCCGQACLAVIENISIEKVMYNWVDVFGNWQGYSPSKRMKEYLKARGYSVKLIRKKDLVEFKENTFYLCRVQWIGEGKKRDKPYYGWGSWYEASNHTHYILIKDEEIFCNGQGVFSYFKICDYLGDISHGIKGVITSFLEIKKVSAL